MKKKEFEEQFEIIAKDLNKLRTAAFGIISSALSDIGIITLPIQSRVKNRESASKKIDLKKYKAPLEEMTDLVGFRIITYVESDVEKIEQKLRGCFEIDSKNSIDKRKPEKLDIVGYRSLHLICRLGKERRELSEYKNVWNIAFEIQVRTILEHAWAEIEHKQNYKSDVALPPNLQRRFVILSGTLELIDRELSAIVDEAQDYQDKIKNSPEEIAADTLSETSLFTITEKDAKNKGITLRNALSTNGGPELLEELFEFGVETNSELQELLTTIDADSYPKYESETTVYGYVRDAMIICDPHKYFKHSFHGQYVIEEGEAVKYNALSPQITDFISLAERYDVGIVPNEH
ncbi:GTP pyrophosphokinase [Cribrihabitans neustonicus]|uniref:GTP pyrophosphokinase n=1 Tax=Cribrihabitans neustonicus TaxID=1429085 RepID=UPI003B5BEDB8